MAENKKVGLEHGMSSLKAVDDAGNTIGEGGYRNKRVVYKTKD